MDSDRDYFLFKGRTECCEPSCTNVTDVTSLVGAAGVDECDVFAGKGKDVEFFGRVVVIEGWRGECVGDGRGQVEEEEDDNEGGE